MQPIPSILYILIHEQSRMAPDAPAILAPGKKPISYQQLFTQLEEVALQLNQLGFQRGDLPGQ